MEALHGAKARFNQAKQAVSELQSTPEGNTLLVPLNSSLYVPGKIVEPNKVIVELGTGYFCEKTVPDAIALIERKISLLIKSIESIETVICHLYLYKLS